MNIDEAFDILQTFEGGDKVVENPNDPGGITKFGISKRAYPSVDIRNLTIEQAKGIMYTDYWVPAGCNNIIPELQYVVLDTAFNMGVGTANKISAEMNGYPSIERYLFLREVYDSEIVEHRQSSIVFLGGWSSRNKQILTLHDTHKI